MIKKMFFLLTCLLFGISLGKTGVWIPLEGDVDPSMNDFVRRAIAEAEKESPDYILFEINTFGGRLDAAFDIVDTILAIRNAKTVAIVKNKAISAGSLIALSSQELYMMEGTTIGDCAPIVQGDDGTPQIVGEKIQSPLRAKFRNLAQRNHYPELLSAAMVTPEMEVLQFNTKDSSGKDSSIILEARAYERLTEKEKSALGSSRVLVSSGELLTMTEKEAVELGFARGVIASRKSVEKILEITRSSEVEMRAGEHFARFIASIAGLLLILGFGALYMEFKTPGFGVFGIVGLCALGLVFFGFAAGKMENFFPFLLLISGVVLFVLEIVVFPGTMLFGIGGLICLVLSLALSIDVSTLPSFLFTFSSDISPLLLGFLYILSCAAFALVFPIALSKYIIPKLPERFTPMLKTDLADSMSPTEEVEAVKVGECGIAQTFLRPVGQAEMNGKILDVQTHGEIIEAGEKVRVLSIREGHIFVGRENS